MKANAGNNQRNVEREPLIFDYNLKGPVTSELELITATGTINTISAFWEFEGEVRLEASANGGLSYTNIINGQPIFDGFIPGNQLRFKANIAEGSELKKLTVGYADTSGTRRAFRNPELNTFKYQKSVYISGANRELFNHPVKIKIEKDIVGRNNIAPDFRDVRFTATDEQTPLAYCLDGGIVLSSSRNDNDNAIANPTKAGEAGSAVFWVKIPQLPKEGITIYLYYGNKNVISASNPEAVFLFFDDFNGSSLSKDKWLGRSESKSQPFVREGVLCLGENSVITNRFKMKAGILEFKANAEKNTAIQGIVHGTTTAESPFPIEETVYSSGFPGAEHAIAVNDVAKLNIANPIQPLTEYIYRVMVNTDGVTFERFDEDNKKQAEIRFLDTYKLDKGYIGLKASTALFGSGSAYFDWVRVRPYVESEPRAVIGN